MCRWSATIASSASCRSATWSSIGWSRSRPSTRPCANISPRPEPVRSVLHLLSARVWRADFFFVLLARPFLRLGVPLFLNGGDFGDFGQGPSRGFAASGNQFVGPMKLEQPDFRQPRIDQNVGGI